MRSFIIDIHPELKNVEVIVKNEKLFEKYLKSGQYHRFEFTTNETDAKRIKKFLIKHGNDNNSNRGDWYAHCNGYCMDLAVMNAGKYFEINTNKRYRRFEYVAEY